MRKPLLALTAFISVAVTFLLASCTPFDHPISKDLSAAERAELVAEIKKLPIEDRKFVEFLVVPDSNSAGQANPLPTVLKNTDVTYRDLIEEGKRQEGR